MHFNNYVCGIIILLLHHCTCDYLCLCNYNVEQPVYKNADSSEIPIGALYEYDCNTLIADSDPLWATIAFHHKVTFVEKNLQTKIQMCPGNEPEMDKLLITAPTEMSKIPTTTSPATSTTQETSMSTTPSPTTAMSTSTTQATTITTTPSPMTTISTTTTQATTLFTKPIPTTMSSTSTSTTLPITNTSTTMAQSTSAISTAASISIDDNLDLCHTYIKNDATKNHGFLGQHGQYCYELVDTPTQWAVAEKHCRLLLSGSLVHILNQNQNEQDYLVKFLTSHTYIKSVWIGLTDTTTSALDVLKATEGNWKWSSGAPYTYNNFGNEFTSHTDHEHNLNDCVVMHQSGEWSDLPCGIFLGIVGFGESHPYICQYNISSSVPDVINVISGIVG